MDMDNRPLSAQIEDALKIVAKRKSAELRAERKMKRIFRSLYLRQSGSVAEREAKAGTDPLYEKAEDEFVDAADRSNLAKAHADALQIKFEEWRTENATRRAEMNLR